MTHIDWKCHSGINYYKFHSSFIPYSLLILLSVRHCDEIEFIICDRIYKKGPIWEIIEVEI